MLSDSYPPNWKGLQSEWCIRFSSPDIRTLSLIHHCLCRTGKNISECKKNFDRVT
ncbi:Uncharacterized protein dnm_027940 [Desulfonema magnum]|uniref:Uncharacterized protein n=1 Tax=Desulfonema magnum TaxID=45655 RepID=A0A975BKH0_9BACT|nr:Uncharacterized protein dnm_027940 [Desulfonema magnum]